MKTLTDEEAQQLIANRSKHRGHQEMFPWDEYIKDGLWHHISEHDLVSTRKNALENFRANLHNKARAKGCKVKTRSCEPGPDGEKGLIFKFYKEAIPDIEEEGTSNGE